MTVFVLAGGLGTRIAGLHPDLPKSLVPVAGRPFIEHQLTWLAEHGLNDVVLCAGHKAADLVAHVGDGSRFGVHVRTVIEDVPRGTGGALAHALLAIDHREGTFFAVNGDTWGEFDRVAMLALHHRLEADATLACYQVRDARERGTVEPGEDGTLRAFAEKAREGPGWVSGGIYALEPRALLGVSPDATPASLERDVFPRLLAEGHVLGAWKARGRFWDMGTPEGLAEAQAALATNGSKEVAS